MYLSGRSFYSGREGIGSIGWELFMLYGDIMSLLILPVFIKSLDFLEPVLADFEWLLYAASASLL